MGINLGSMGNGMAPILNLEKNDILDLTKRNPGLTNITVACGWDTARVGSSFDLDVSALLLGSNGKLCDNKSIIYFNNKTANGIRLNGDNLTGDGDGDDETIDVQLDRISPEVQRIVFSVNIYDAVNRRQTFGMVQNSYIRLINNAGGQELCRFELKDNGSTSTAVIFAELFRDNGEWQFKALGDGRIADLTGLVNMYR